MFEFWLIKYPTKNNAKPWTKAPTTNSSPKKLATLPVKVVDIPSVLNPKIISKIQSNNTITNISDHIKNILLIKLRSYLLKILNVSIKNNTIKKNLKTLGKELIGYKLKNIFVSKDKKKNSKR